LCSSKLKAQTTLIDPAGAGGFELGTTFSANGWTEAQSTNGNKWYVGTFTKTAGSRGVYVGTSNSNNSYNKWGLPSASRTQHFYRDVTFPSGETDITLSFKWRCEGESDHDDIKVFLAPTSVTPAAGTAINASYLVGGAYDSEGTYQTVTIKLSASNAGTTKRLIFQWRNDNNLFGTDPAGSFDEISLTTCTPLPAPTTTSGSLCDLGAVPVSATPGVGGNSINWWDAPTGGNLLLANAMSANVNVNATGSYTFYASTVNTVSGCGSIARTAVTATVYPKLSANPSATVISGCPPYNTTVNGGVVRTAKSTVSYSIPDNNTTGITSNVNVSGLSTSLNNTTVRIESVKFNITHTYDGDLIIYLKAPDGTQITLVNRRGGSGDNFTNTVLKTGGTPIASGSAPFTGTYAPEVAFSNLNGKNPNGIWGLVVTDRAGGDVGSLQNWEISFVDDNGLTYTWTSTPSGFTNSSSGFTTSVISNITYNLSVNNASQGCSASGNIAMAASPSPMPVASSGGDVCLGSDIYLTGDNLASGQSSGNTYVWTGPNGFTSSTQNPIINSPGISASGTYNVVVTNQYGCTALATTDVVVNANPVLNLISQGYSGCDGTVDMEATGGTGPYDYTYDFMYFNQNGDFTGIPAPGSITVYSSDANGCQATPYVVNFAQRTFNVMSVAGANGSISPSGTTAVNCDGNITYTITPANCNYKISDVLVNGVSVGAVGSYTFNNVMSDDSIRAVFVLRDQPQTPANAVTDAFADEICVGGNVQLTVSGGAFGEMSGSYKWYKGSCGGVLVGTGQNITVSPTTTTTYYARIEDACGNVTSCVTVDVNVKTTGPSKNVDVPISGMPGNACPGTTASLSVMNIPNASRYIWDGPPGTTFDGNPSPYTSMNPNVAIVFGTTNNSMYSIGVQAGNSCGNTLRKIQKTRYMVSVPKSIGGATTMCANTSGVYTIDPIEGASNYEWTITGDATVSGTGTTATVNFGPSWNGGTLCVSAKTSCYTSPSKCLAISTSASPLNAISGSFTACPNGTLTYSVPPSNGAATYNWTLPANASGSSGTNSINVNFLSGFNNVGNICVSVTSICGITSAPKCKTVAPGLPARPATINGITNGLCNVPNVNYIVAGEPGVTYNWTAPGTITGNGNSAVGISFNTFTTGQVCVSATNGCGTSAERCVSVKGAPNTPVSITADPSSWCAYDAGILFNADLSNITGNYNLLWSYPANTNYVQGGGNNGSITLDWGGTNGVVMLTASNACGSGTKVFNVVLGCRESSMTDAAKLNVYPNPTAGFVNVEFTSAKGNAQITVMDLSGRVVMQQSQQTQAGQNTVQLDLSKLAKGAYMLNVQTIEGNKQVKVVVE
jgi:subtilisin-like proprotein convertase family protein